MKGFVHTLEAVIASSMILIMVAVVLPQATQNDDFELDSAIDGLEDLEERGELVLDPAILKVQAEPYIPETYNHSVTVRNMETNYTSMSAPEEIYFNSSGNTELQIWVRSANNLNVSFRETQIVENRNREGYIEQRLGSSEGWLNTTGSGNLEISFNTFTESGSIPERDNIYTQNLLVYKNTSSEIKVAAYR